MHSLTLFFAAIFATRTTHAQGTCYFANGTALPNIPGYNEYEPCTSGPSTICCGTNRALPAGVSRTPGSFVRDECLPNGLCQNRYLDPNNGTEKISYVTLSTLFYAFRVVTNRKADFGSTSVPTRMLRARTASMCAHRNGHSETFASHHVMDELIVTNGAVERRRIAAQQVAW